MSGFRTKDNRNVEALVDDDGELKIDQNLDAFNALRVTSPVSQFEHQNEYNKGPLIWAEKIIGTGVAAHQPNPSTVLLSTGGILEGDGIIRQTYQYMRYSPGKSLKWLVTYNLHGEQDSHYIKRVGYFDNLNGPFVELDGDTLSFVIRSSSTGVVVEDRIPQSEWIIKKLNGEDLIDPILDLTKTEINFGDVQWLGVGSVRFGFEIDGIPYYAHIFHHANKEVTTYMATANLPIRYEVINKDGALEPGLLTQICATVLTEQGALDDTGFYEHSVNNGIIATTVTTRRSVIAIRTKSTFGGKINRATLKHETFEVTTGGANVLWELIYNPTLGGSPSWASAGDNSIAEFDIAGTTITGGEVVASGYALAGTWSSKGQTKSQTQSKYPMGRDVDGNNPRIMALVCTSLGGNASVNVSIGFKEYY